MPSRTLRIRASRHRTAQGPTSAGSSRGSAVHRPPAPPPPPPALTLAEGGSRGGGAARAQGTTLGYVKHTWSELVRRCENSRQEEATGPKRDAESSPPRGLRDSRG
ncbi:hypothetical protein ACOMHN_038474 [Nucella lapillus]